jgi:protein TonB
MAAPAPATAPARPLGGSATPPPDYPPASRRRGEQGRVTLRIEVDATGQVVDVAVQRSAGYVDLDQAAMRAVRRWRFTPAIQQGQPVFSITAVDISFRLEGDRRW